MAKIIQDLWILTTEGTKMFSRIQEEKLNEKLFGALMKALDTFASQVTNGGVSNFELAGKRFNIAKRDNLFFVVSSNPKVKMKKVISVQESIINKFFDKYKTVLKDWDDENSIFEGFENDITDSLEKTN